MSTSDPAPRRSRRAAAIASAAAISALAGSESADGAAAGEEEEAVAMSTEADLEDLQVKAASGRRGSSRGRAQGRSRGSGRAASSKRKAKAEAEDEEDEEDEEAEQDEEEDEEDEDGDDDNDENTRRKRAKKSPGKAAAKATAKAAKAPKVPKAKKLSKRAQLQLQQQQRLATAAAKPLLDPQALPQFAPPVDEAALKTHQAAYIGFHASSHGSGIKILPAENTGAGSAPAADDGADGEDATGVPKTQNPAVRAKIVDCGTPWNAKPFGQYLAMTTDTLMLEPTKQIRTFGIHISAADCSGLTPDSAPPETQDDTGITVCR